MNAAIKLTYDDYVQMPEGLRYELLEGDLFMTPSPNTHHQRTSRRLFDVLEAHVLKTDAGEVFYAPYDVLLSNSNVLQPDILFISKKRLNIITAHGVEGAPDLVVEILSPSTRQLDMGMKRRLYAKYGVREYWIVDPDGRTVEVAALKEEGFATEQVHTEGSAVRSPLFPGFSFDPKAIF